MNTKHYVTKHADNFCKQVGPRSKLAQWRPDLDPIRPSDGVPGIKIIEKVDLEKKSADN